MDVARLDRITRSLTARLSRRTALRTSGLGLAAGLAGASPLRASAQDAIATPSTAEVLTNDAFLFVQSATSGTFAANPGAGTPTADGTPVAGGGAAYLLTLSGHTGSTVFFSDRPERIFGAAPTQRFLDGLGFGIANPPNAALVTNDEDGNEDILVAELVDPTYDASAGTVTYGVNLLGDYEGGLGFAASRQRDQDLAPSFGNASLFIDDCPDADPLDCLLDCAVVGDLGDRGNCWSWSDFRCEPCSGGWDGTAQECNQQIAACDGSCVTDGLGCVGAG